MYLHSVLFELELIRSMEQKSLPPVPEKAMETAGTSSKMNPKTSQGVKSILLKGQMIYVVDIEAIIFLCSPL